MTTHDWSRTGVGLLLAACLGTAGPVTAAAHPGHGTMALVGTLAAVEADAVVLAVRDVASGGVTRIRVGVSVETKLRLRKETIASLTPWIGAAAVATVDYDEGPDGQTVYRATKIQITPPKTRGR